MSDGQRSGRSTGRVSCRSTELKRCSMTEMRWKRYEVSLASPVWTQILLLLYRWSSDWLWVCVGLTLSVRVLATIAPSTQLVRLPVVRSERLRMNLRASCAADTCRPYDVVLPGLFPAYSQRRIFTPSQKEISLVPQKNSMIRLRDVHSSLLSKR